MAFFEELGKRITDAGQGVARSTKNFTQVTKLNAAISAKEKERKELFAQFGRLCYEKGGRPAPEDVAGPMEAIRALTEEMENLQAEVERIKSAGKCPACGAELPQDALFCPACGAAAPEAAPVEESAAPQRLCPSCGKEVGAENRFCTFCGAKLD